MSLPSLLQWTSLVVAALLGVGGVVVVARALFRDRARGRPRCPRCWYDMSGSAGTTCPECGRTPRHARSLLKTRRRWGRAAIGLAMLVLSLPVAVGIPMLQHGVVAGAPTWMHIVAVGNTTSWSELVIRLRQGKLRRWEFRLLASTAARRLPTHPESVAILKFMFEIESHRNSAPYLSWPMLEDLELPHIVSRLIPLLDHEDPGVRDQALVCLSRCRSAADQLIPKLMSRLGSHPQYVGDNRLSPAWPDKLPVFDFYSTSSPRWTTPPSLAELLEELRRCNGDVPAMVEFLTRGLDGNAVVRTHAIWGLSYLAPADPAVQARIIEVAREDSHVRDAAIRFLGRLPLDDRVVDALRIALSNPEDVREALGVIKRYGAEGRVFEADLLRLIQSGMSAAIVAPCWFAISAPKGPLCEALSSLLHDTDPWQRRRVLRAIAQGCRSDPAQLEVMRAEMGHHHPEVRLAAAFGAARMGEDLTHVTRFLIDQIPYEGATMSKDMEYRSPRDDLRTLAAEGLVDFTVVADLLESTDPNLRHEGVCILHAAGPLAAPVLPRLRKMVAVEPGQTIAEFADETLERIEWQIDHPEAAAKLRPWTTDPN